jgi:hypothetical protein
MRKGNSIVWTRILLALVAVLVVGGPGLVMAASPKATYGVPSYAQVLGPTVVAPGGTADYDLKVFFTDGTSQTFTGTPATFSAVTNPIDSATGAYTATNSGRDRVGGSFTSSGVTVTAFKSVFIQ